MRVSSQRRMRVVVHTSHESMKFGSRLGRSIRLLR